MCFRVCDTDRARAIVACPVCGMGVEICRPRHDLMIFEHLDDLVTCSRVSCPGCPVLGVLSCPGYPVHEFSLRDFER